MAGLLRGKGRLSVRTTKHKRVKTLAREVKELRRVNKARADRAWAVWKSDGKAGAAGVEVLDALAVKYPDLGQRWSLFWILIASKIVDRSTLA